jgi:DNA-binding MarR family transcriptional regulator
MHAREPLTDKIIGDMAVVYASLQDLNVPQWLRLDLPMAQFRALVVVNHRPALTVGELGCQLSIGQSAASLLVEQLVRRGLVGRTEDPADRRRALLACTPAGEALLAELRHGNQETLKGWLALLSAEELEGLARALRVLYQAARAPAQDTETITKETAK